MKNNFIQVACFLLVLLFLYTGMSKFLNFHQFYFDVNNQPFPNVLTPFLVWFIPCLEILIAISLFFQTSRRAGLYASLALMSLFTLYTALVLLNAFPYTPCSCGGVIKSLTWPQHLVFNLFFVIITSIALKFYPTNSIQTGYNYPIIQPEGAAEHL